jgi:hypothetical protein
MMGFPEWRIEKKFKKTIVAHIDTRNAMLGL